MSALFCAGCTLFFVIHLTPAWRRPTACFFCMSRHWKQNWRAEKPATTMTCEFHLLLTFLVKMRVATETNKAELFFICDPTREVYEERISSCRITLKSHKESYFQNPLAQELLALQAEKEEIEHRIEACDDQLTMKQKELDLLTSNRLFYFIAFCPGTAEVFVALYAVIWYLSEQVQQGILFPLRRHQTGESYKQQRIIIQSFSQSRFILWLSPFVCSVFSQQPVTEEHQTQEDSDSSIDISSLHLSQASVWHFKTDQIPEVANCKSVAGPVSIEPL